jgi:hypothetical protein
MVWDRQEPGEDPDRWPNGETRRAIASLNLTPGETERFMFVVERTEGSKAGYIRDVVMDAVEGELETLGWEEREAPADKGWLEQLREWDADGTLDRLEELAKSRDPIVNVKRSDGSITGGAWVHEVGFGGRAVTVAFLVDGEERYKLVHTEDFIPLNKELFDGKKAKKEEPY